MASLLAHALLICLDIFPCSPYREVPVLTNAILIVYQVMIDKSSQ